MQAETITTVINRQRDDVFAYLNDINNVTEWAFNFAKELKVINGSHKVVTPAGELFLRYDSHPDLGLIDMWGGPAEDQMTPLPVRVLPLANGSSAVTITLTQTPDVDDAVFKKQVASLNEESAGLKTRLEK
ncbi:MAG TPA: hypothetical protein VHR64_12570 [Thermomicrobiales bacterium]|jgi:hypothetical protein|nr:hypothetical protein [Thermomicrobiales bacterium]